MGEAPSLSRDWCQGGVCPRFAAATVAAKWDEASRRRSAGAPASRMRPSARTITWSLSRMVEMRCAMTRRVADSKASDSRSVRWMWASVSRSTFAVASSMATMRRRSTRARARHMSCRSPADQLAPPSSTGVARIIVAEGGLGAPPPSVERDESTNLASSRASRSAARIASSSNWSKGSMLKRSAPENSDADCGITASAPRSRASGNGGATSTPSIRTRPPQTSWSRAIALSIDDLPLPVRPTRPVFVQGRNRHETPRRTGARSAR
mmetsp:Transcript_23670/g.93869  ORF Transcript_23670/g.93869 Transcript_23670/m.93869 type:complete len:266 (-) Transcript_23670:77-874(-)